MYCCGHGEESERRSPRPWGPGLIALPLHDPHARRNSARGQRVLAAGAIRRRTGDRRVHALLARLGVTRWCEVRRRGVRVSIGGLPRTGRLRGRLRRPRPRGGRRRLRPGGVDCCTAVVHRRRGAVRGVVHGPEPVDHGSRASTPPVHHYPGRRVDGRPRAWCGGIPIDHQFNWGMLTAGKTLSSRLVAEAPLHIARLAESFEAHESFRSLNARLGGPWGLPDEMNTTPQHAPWRPEWGPAQDGLPGIDVPVLEITGPYDIAERGAIEHHRRYCRARPADQRPHHHIILGPW